MKFQVYINIGKLENPRPNDPKLPIPIAVNACFDKLEIRINSLLLKMMESHLTEKEYPEESEGDTDFDRWIHGQVYKPEYNMV